MPSLRARKWLALFAALGLAVAALPFWLVGDSGRWDLLPSMLLSGGRLRPARSEPASTAAALDLRPLPEIHLTAPAGALDRDRSFNVARCDDAALRQMAPAARAVGIHPLAAFRIDAGMKPDDRFPGELTIRIDLDRLAVPLEQRARFAAAHLHPGMAPERLRVALDGNEAVLRVRHNDPITTGILLSALGGVTKYLLNKVSAEKEGDQIWMQDQTAHFLLHWHPWEPAADPATAQQFYDRLRDMGRVQDDLDIRRDNQMRSGMPDPEIEAQQHRLEAMQADLDKSFPPDVRRQKIWPESLQRFATALESAYQYLVDVRGFKAPGFLVDVYLRLPWPHGTAIALTQKLPTTNPFIDVSGGTDLDEIQIGSLHEMFHVVEKQYRTTGDWAGYGWFDEASARVLEADAQDYFLQHGLAKKWNLTQRSFITYQRGLDDPPAGDADVIQHGYAASHFFQYLQDNYYKGNRDQFLVSLYGDLSSWSGGRLKSLMRKTSNQPATISDDFRAFVNAHSADILAHGLLPQERKVALTAASPSHDWSRSFASLSASSCWLRLPGVPAAEQAATRVVIQEMSPSSGGVTQWSNGSGVTALKDGEGIAIPQWQGAVGHLDVQRIEPYDDPYGTLSSPRTRMFAMFRPAAPTPSVEGKSLRLRWQKSRIADLGLVREYRAKLRPPRGPELTVRVSDVDSTISLAQLRALLRAQDTGAATALREQVKSLGSVVRAQVTNQDLLDFWDIAEFNEYLAYKKQVGPRAPWVIRYQEAAATKQDLVGPESQPASIEIPPSDLDPGNFDPSGDWVGRILLTDIVLDMSLQSDGGGVSGRAAIRGNRLKPVVGKWDPKWEAWMLEGVAQGKNSINPKDLPPFLRALLRLDLHRFPDERLWVPFPPMLFHRTNARAAPRE